MRKSPNVAHNGPAAVASAAETFDAAVDHALASAAAAASAVTALRSAEEKYDRDRRAAVERADAIPTRTPVEKAAAKSVAAREAAEEAKKVAIGRGRNLTREVAGNADAWRRDLADMEAEALERLATAAEVLDQAVGAAVDALALSRWIDTAEGKVRAGTLPPDPPAYPVAEAVLDGRDPRPALDRFRAWLAAGCQDAPHVRQWTVEDPAA